MEKIVDGILYTGNYLEDSWEVRTWQANGIMERSARQIIEWTETGPCPPVLTWEEYLSQFDGKELEKRLQERAELEEERKARALRKAAQRAKQVCRRTIMSEGFNEMLTLTYRENQGDRALCKKHFKEWVRRMKRSLPGFRYCASFERQERGAMHVHVATHKLPVHAAYKGVQIKAWKLGTEVWRAIVGKDNGLCHVGGKTRFGTTLRKKMSLAKIAAYVSKYIMKDYEESPPGSNRYSASEGREIPKPEVMRFTNCSLSELIAVCFELGEGDVLVSHNVGHFKDSLWFCKEVDRDGQAEKNRLAAVV